jgi:hypothetical protein
VDVGSVAKFYHEDGDRMYLRNVGNTAHIYTANFGISNNNGPAYKIKINPKFFSGSPNLPVLLKADLSCLGD